VLQAKDHLYELLLKTFGPDMVRQIPTEILMRAKASCTPAPCRLGRSTLFTIFCFRTSFPTALHSSSSLAPHGQPKLYEERSGFATFAMRGYQSDLNMVSSDLNMVSNRLHDWLHDAVS
jgi:hypothetical protein